MIDTDNKPQFFHGNDGGRYTVDAVIPLGKVWGIPTVSAISIQVDHSGYASKAKRIASELLNQAKLATKNWIGERQTLIPEGATDNMWAGATRISARHSEECVLFPDQPCTGNDPLTCHRCSYSPDHTDRGATLNGQPFIVPKDIQIRKRR